MKYYDPADGTELTRFESDLVSGVFLWRNPRRDTVYTSTSELDKSPYESKINDELSGLTGCARRLGTFITNIKNSKTYEADASTIETLVVGLDAVREQITNMQRVYMTEARAGL